MNLKKTYILYFLKNNNKGIWKFILKKKPEGFLEVAKSDLTKTHRPL